MAADDIGRCIARTESGDRCSRPAGEDGFCHQHGPEDETVAEREADGDRSNGSTTPKDTEQMAEDSDTETEIERVRAAVQRVTEDVVGHPLDGITRIGRDDDQTWTVAVEVRERKGVPDTQDILGRYELRLDEDLTVTSYERTHRYRRDDMEQNV